LVLELRKKVTGNRDFRGCSQARTGMAGGENASECRAPPHAFNAPGRTAWHFYIKFATIGSPGSDWPAIGAQHARTHDDIAACPTRLIQVYHHTSTAPVRKCSTPQAAMDGDWHHANGGGLPFRRPPPTVDEALPYSPFTSIIPFSPGASLYFTRALCPCAFLSPG